MPIIGNNGRALLHGLSDFWLRFFKDLGDVEATYEGAAVLLGQTYLNLLSDVLNTSIDDVPLFKQEYYKLITIREDQVLYVDPGIPGLESWRIVTPRAYGKLPYLQNKIFEPTAGFDDTLDYDVVEGKIFFKTDPTRPIPDLFASRDVDVVITGTFSSAGTDWVAAGVKKNDVLVVNKYNAVSALTTVDPPGTQRYRICNLSADTLYLMAGATLPESLTGYSWRIERKLTTGSQKVGMPGLATFTGAFSNTTSMRVREMALWAVDAMVDDARLYTVYGHYFGAQRFSSESYRSFIRGLMQLYVFGPVVDRIESALNVIAGLPVIRDDGETLLAYNNGLDDAAADGSVTGNTFTSASAAFEMSDVGGFIQIVDADNAVNLGTFQVITVVNSTTVTLGNLVSFTAETDVTWEFSRTDLQTVTTDRTVYEFPRRVPMRSDVVDPANFGSLTFHSFEALTTAAIVTDYIKDPEWWIDVTLPQAIINRESPAQRTPSPQLLPNIVGPVGEFNIGDPGFYISASEDGEPVGHAELRSGLVPVDVVLSVPETLTVTYGTAGALQSSTCTFPPWTYISLDHYLEILNEHTHWTGGALPQVTFTADGIGGITAKTVDMGPDVSLTITQTVGIPFPTGTATGFVGRHHRAAFILMDRFLKTHILSVSLNANIDLSGALIQDMQKVLLDVKPAHVALFFQPLTRFKELITISDTLAEVKAKMATGPDFFTLENNEFVVGSSWLIGNGWRFSASSGGAIDIGIGSGYLPAAIGGADPGISPTHPADEPVAYYIDRVLYVNPRAP
jgi:hypothetical protein